MLSHEMAHVLARHVVSPEEQWSTLILDKPFPLSRGRC